MKKNSSEKVGKNMMLNIGFGLQFFFFFRFLKYVKTQGYKGLGKEKTLNHLEKSQRLSIKTEKIEKERK